MVWPYHIAHQQIPQASYLPIWDSGVRFSIRQQVCACVFVCVDGCFDACDKIGVFVRSSAFVCVCILITLFGCATFSQSVRFRKLRHLESCVSTDADVFVRSLGVFFCFVVFTFLRLFFGSATFAGVRFFRVSFFSRLLLFFFGSFNFIFKTRFDGQVNAFEAGEFSLHQVFGSFCSCKSNS